MTLDPGSIVITDTSVRINLSHTGHLLLLGRTAGSNFFIPDEVLAEVTRPDQREFVDAALAASAFTLASIQSTEELAGYAELLQILGSGEAACLALAACRGRIVASDEKRVFLREARFRLGEGRVLNSAGLYLMWIQKKLLTVDEADQAKRTLEANRFKFSFTSFRELI